MSCEVKTLSGETESILAKYLTTNINEGDMNVTTDQIKYFRSPAFVKEFGDYDAAIKADFDGEYGEMAARTDENGEPLLQYNDTAQKHYFIDKRGQQVYFPLRAKGLKGILTYKEIETLTSKVALQYFKASGINFNNINFKESESLPNLKLAITKILDDKFNALNESEDYDENIAATVIDVIKDHTDELEKNVREFFTRMSIKLVEDENSTTANDLGETTRDGLGLQSSAERDSKESVSMNVKLKLSLLEDIQYLLDGNGNPKLDKSNNPIVDPKSIDPIWNEPGYAEFSDVYSTLLSIFSDSTDLHGEDIWQIYKDRIATTKNKKPFLVELERQINDPKFSKEDVNEFVQAFRLNKNNHMQSDVTVAMNNTEERNEDGNLLRDPETGAIMQVEVVTHKNYGISEAGSKTQIVKEGWFNNFKAAFLNDLNKPTKESSVKAAGFVKAFTQIRTLINKAYDSEAYEPSDLDDHITRLITGLGALGVKISSRGISNYLDNNGQNLEDSYRVEKLKDIVNASISAAINIETSMKSKFPYTSNKFFGASLTFLELAKSEAFFMADGSDANVRQGGKNLYIYSYPSYLSTKFAQWKKSSTQELERMKNAKDVGYIGEPLLTKLLKSSPYLKGSFTLQYLTGEVNMDGEIMEYFGDTPYEEALFKLEESVKRLESFNLGMFNQMSKNSAFKSTTDLTYKDYLADDVQKTLKNGFTRTIAPADKTTEYGIETGIQLTAVDFENNKPVISAAVRKIQFNYFASEYNRIIEANNDVARSIQSGANGADLTAHYHFNYGNATKDGISAEEKTKRLLDRSGNAFQSQYYDRLSPNAKGLTVEEQAIHDKLYIERKPSLDLLKHGMDAELTAMIEEYINTEMMKNVRITFEALIDSDIIRIGEDGVYTMKGIDSTIIDSYNANYGHYSSASAAYAMATDYYVNGVTNHIEYSKMFTGDVAYYKNPVDFKKRVPATYTDGLQLRIEPGQEYFKIATIEGVYRASPFLKELGARVNGVDILGDVANEYANINSSDAQAWITPKRWAFLVKGLGKWSTGKDSYESVYKKMMSDVPVEYSEKELKLAAQPLKGVYFGRDNRSKPVFLKYSQAVLSRQMVAGSDLELLYDKMEKNGIDETITFDGIKVGSITPTKIHDVDGNILPDFELNEMVLNNKEWKLQQDLPTKTYKDTDVGSQIQKNIFAGLIHNRTNEDFFLDNNYVSGQYVMDEIVKTVTGMSNSGLAKVKKEFKIDDNYEMKDVKGFYKSLIGELETRGGSTNVIDALKAEIALPGIPQAGSKLINMFTSIMNDRLIKIKTNGGSFIQMSNFGMNKTTGNKIGVMWAPYADSTVNEPYPYKDPTTGKTKIKLGGVLVSPTVISKYLPNWRSLTEEQLFGTYQEVVNEDGVVIHELIEAGALDPKILDNIIGYRIPNQGLASNDALRIVGILPESSGDTVVAYTGITTKTGSDFDIDKMYMMFPHVKPVMVSSAEIYNNANTFIKNNNITSSEMLSQLNDEDVLFNPEGLTGKTLTDFYISEVLIGGENSFYGQEFKNNNDVALKDVVSVKYADTAGNRLIELYKSVLTNPIVYPKVMTPIDMPFISDEINSIMPDVKSKNILMTFDPIADIKLRYSFLGGKAGVGQEANALVDISRPGIISLTDTYLGWGHKNAKGDTVFDREYSEVLSQEDLAYYIDIMRAEKGAKFDEASFRASIEKIAIGDSLTAILNAFVDIAKDPYITKGNWTTSTTNVGNLLLRSGMHPIKVINFMAQPILKQFTEFENGLKSLGDEDGQDVMYLFKKQQVMEALDAINPEYKRIYRESPTLSGLVSKRAQLDENKYFNQITEEDYNTGVAEIDKKLTRIRKKVSNVLKQEGMTPEDIKILSDNAMDIIAENHRQIYSPENTSVDMNLEYYRTQITDPSSRNNIFQTAVLLKFQELQKSSQSLGAGLKVARADTTGLGKNINSLYALSNAYDAIIANQGNKGALAGFESKFDNTVLEAYFTSLMEVKKIVDANPNLFPQGSKTAQNMFNIISNDLKGTDAMNVELTDSLEVDYNSYLISNMFNLSAEEVTRLITTLPERFSIFRAENEGKYFMLEDLISKSPKVNELRTIGLNNRKKDKFYEKSFTDSWEDLAENDPKMAEDLIKYAFVTTGFKMSATQFFTYIPYTHFVKNNINKFVGDFAKQSQEDFIDLYYRNNFDKIVKNLKKGSDITTLSSIQLENGGEKITSFSIPLETNAKFYVNYAGATFKLQGFQSVNDMGVPITPVYAAVKKATLTVNGKELTNYNPYKVDDLHKGVISESDLIDARSKVVYNRLGFNIETMDANALTDALISTKVSNEAESSTIEGVVNNSNEPDGYPAIDLTDPEC
jgi:hypothetical protein